MVYAIIGLIQLTLLFFAFSQETKRLFVFEHVRHGARSPWQALNKNYEDVFGEKWSGMGELTSVGLRMHFLLGVRNRKRYIPFLHPNYDPNEIMIYSTDVNRTISSIGAQLQGLYPTVTGPTLTEGQLKYAIPPNTITPSMEEEIKQLRSNALPNQMNLLPVHIFNPDARDFSLHDNVNCPPLKKVKEDNVNSEKMKELLRIESEKFNATFGEQLFRYFNLTDPNFYFNSDNIYDFADIFISTYTDGREMKKFKETKIDFELLYMEALYISFLITYQFEFTSEKNFISVMSMSPTYRKILNWMDERYKLNQEGKADAIVGSAPKMVIYSGHDTTLAANYYFMKELFEIPVEQSYFTSNIYLELIIKNTNEYYVQFYSNDNLMKEIPYAEFTNKVSKALWTPDEIQDYCYGKHTVDVFMILSIVLGGLMTILGVTLGIVLYNRKKKKFGAILTEPLSHSTDQ